jgi:hypothetical protein
LLDNFDNDLLSRPFAHWIFIHFDEYVFIMIRALARASRKIYAPPRYSAENANRLTTRLAWPESWPAAHQVQGVALGIGVSTGFLAIWHRWAIVQPSTPALK